MSADVRRMASVLLAVLLLAVSATTARAATDTDAPGPGKRIAAALRTSPVYVDEAYTTAVPQARQRQLAEQIRKTGLPIKVVLTPLTKGDAFNGDSDDLAAVVHDRLGMRDLILITTDSDFADSLNGYEWPSDTHQTSDAVSAVGFLDEMRDAGLADLTAKAVELVAQGDGTKVYEEATKDLGGDSPASPSPKPSSGEASSGGGPWSSRPTLLAVSTLALLAAGGALFLVRNRRTRRYGRTAGPSPFAHPQAVFAAARAADEAALRRRAEAEVLALGEAAEAADVSDTPGLQHALDAYAAAGTVLDAARGLPDLAGVLALVAEGRDALADSRSALPLCFFTPLHGRAVRRTTWRPLGRRDRAQVAVCPECAAALRARRAPEVLTDVAEGGRSVPYFEVAGERSVWAATGYGSLLRGGDSLARRVARGDFTRSVGGESGQSG
ncbi:hypothetical protein [Streptomyces sp. NBC_00078]|uniref:hypothetical protein n=1 Tax=unclassified Streptomyces TaxID=2593676 RepID=UPI00225A9E23|nr:hypothetical protein [Streptomyces sp. NBC_00078]MCX5420906.1 hypothetical protein [Streptomyces sp. NBC_00078]